MKEGIYLSDSLSGLMKEATKETRDYIGGALRFYIRQYQEMSKVNNPESMAYNYLLEIQKLLDISIKEVKGDHVPKCGKGCSFCCHVNVDITIDEAVLLIGAAGENKFNIPWEQVEAQSKITPDTWVKQPAAMRKCVFLDNDGACQVYEHRPSSCRKLLVFTEPALCDLDNGTTEVGRLSVNQAEVIASAMMNAVESGQMPNMLLKAKKYIDDTRNNDDTQN